MNRIPDVWRNRLENWSEHGSKVKADTCTYAQKHIKAALVPVSEAGYIRQKTCSLGQKLIDEFEA